MPKDRDPDELDRDESEPDDDVRGLDEDEESEDADDLEEDADEEEQLGADERVTREVGDEGGSEGDVVVTRRPWTSREEGNDIGEQPPGSEATETLRRSPMSRAIDRTGDDDRPRRRSP
jgi:hypothetical protein